MKTTMSFRAMSFALIFSITVLPLEVYAGSISTDSALDGGDGAAATASLAREQATRLLVGWGIDAPSAADRTASLTDDEATRLAREAGNIPAGGLFGGGVTPVLLLIVIGAAIYWQVHKK